MCNHRSNSSDDGFVQLGKPDINLEKAVHPRKSLKARKNQTDTKMQKATYRVSG
jgi:hypothetical protein